VTEVLAVVPARGGSKGLPRKNLRVVGGRSLVAWAVAAASESTLVTRIVGSTDDAEIAEELERAGAEVPQLRPASLAGDEVPDAPVFLQVLGMLEESGYTPDIVVNVRPTAPLRTGSDIDAAVGVLLAHPEADSVKSVSPVTEHPYKMWTLDPDDRLAALRPDWHRAHDGDPDAPRQTLPAVYRSNGAVDAVRVEAFRRSGRFHPGTVVAYVMGAERAVDIDDDRDLEVADHLLQEGMRP
jgi:N-acylneuraminate cytidylyltransferase